MVCQGLVKRPDAQQQSIVDRPEDLVDEDLRIRVRQQLSAPRKGRATLGTVFILFDKRNDTPFAAHRLVDMPIECRELLAECREHFLPGWRTSAPLSKCHPDLVKGETKILRLVDEVEWFQHVYVIASIAIFASYREGDQPVPLVKADTRCRET
ncbi:hypothetical protein MPC4_220002 [Methylocella tundrae]|uniref:Uncharacterized protein n=1 Tax=Methylocella tundrae TaxID=227605 RepID=A0A8B6M886_METTU|nr:hypothetical protein MPC1_570007 [Methylocella tundrae]VTZ50272.1 hypothetical protein MPC4_220002 [Methylocella tundrae]